MIWSVFVLVFIANIMCTKVGMKVRLVVQVGEEDIGCKIAGVLACDCDIIS